MKGLSSGVTTLYCRDTTCSNAEPDAGVMYLVGIAQRNTLQSGQLVGDINFPLSLSLYTLVKTYCFFYLVMIFLCPAICLVQNAAIVPNTGKKFRTQICEGKLQFSEQNQISCCPGIYFKDAACVYIFICLAPKVLQFSSENSHYRLIK